MSRIHVALASGVARSLVAAYGEGPDRANTWSRPRRCPACRHAWSLHTRLGRFAGWCRRTDCACAWWAADGFPPTPPTQSQRARRDAAEHSERSASARRAGGAVATPRDPHGARVCVDQPAPPQLVAAHDLAAGQAVPLHDASRVAVAAFAAGDHPLATAGAFALTTAPAEAQRADVEHGRGGGPGRLAATWSGCGHA